MSNIQTAFLFLLVLVLFFSSCYKRLACDASKDKKLGNIEYSAEFQKFEIEQSTMNLAFVDDGQNITFDRKELADKPPYRLKEYTICESIDVKPYKAYAYYEYKNLNALFGANDIIIHIEPQIEKEKEERVEHIYLSIAAEQTFKASIPIADKKVGLPLDGSNMHFELKDNITINGKAFQNIWLGQTSPNGTGIFYSKKEGIVAIKLKGKTYLRI